MKRGVPTNDLSWLKRQTVWEPSSNRGYMVSALREYFRRVTGTDVFDYSEDPATEIVQEAVFDFLISWTVPTHIEAQGVDWIISNPPFRLSEEFLHRAIEIGPRRGIALLLRLQWLECVGRWERVFSPYAPGLSMHPFAERINLFKGGLYNERNNGAERVSAPPRAYAWFVCRAPYAIDRALGEFPVRHIAPCRAELERPEDYEKSRRT